MKFSKEPIVWISFIVAVIVLSRNIYLGEPITSAAFDPVIVALGGILGRKLVTPVAKK